MEDKFRLPQAEIEKFKKAQSAYKHKTETNLSFADQQKIEIDTQYEKSIEFLKSSLELKTVEIDFNNPAHHRLLANGLLIQKPICRWQKYDFVKNYSNNDLRLALYAMAKHEDWRHANEDSTSFFTNKNLDIASALMSIPSLRFFKIVNSALKMAGIVSKDSFNKEDLAAIEAIKPGFFDDKSFRKDFLTVFKLDQDAHAFLTQKIDNDLDKLEAFAKANQVKLDELDKKTKEKLSAILEKLEQEEREKDFEHKIEAAKSTFNDISSLGAAINNPALMKAGSIGQNAVKIGETLHALKSDLPFLKTFLAPTGALGTAFSGLAFIQPYMALATAAVQIGMTLFGKPKEDQFAKNVMEALQAILKDIKNMRKEMHERFNTIDENLREISHKIDTVYYALSSLIKINDEKQLKNMNYGFSQIAEDIQHVQDVLETLIKEYNLNDLNEKILGIDRHKQGEIALEARDVKLHDLNTIEGKLFSTWLTNNLVSNSYNGGIYSTNSTRQDSHFVGKGNLYTESALGFLYRFASREDKLDLGNTLSGIEGNKLPAVDLWIHAVQADLVARLYAAQAYAGKLRIDGIAQLKQIAANTISFINRLVADVANETNPYSLFKVIAAKYEAAMSKLKQTLIDELATKLKNSDKEYTLKEVLKEKWIDLTVVNNVGAEYVQKVIDYKDTAEKRIPLLLLLADKFKLGNYSGNCVVTINGGTVNYDINYSGPSLEGLKVETGSADISLVIQFSSANLITIRSAQARELIFHGSVAHKLYNQKVAEFSVLAQKYDHRTDAQWISAANISKIEVSANIKNDLNGGEVYKSLAEKIIAAKQAGTNLIELLGEKLAENCEQLFNEAVTSTHDNKVKTKAELQTIQVMHSVALAYADLIGLPEQTATVIKQQLIAEPLAILQNPTIFPTVANRTAQVIQKINDSLPLRHSRIIQKMTAVTTVLDDFLAMSSLNNGYKENLSQWMSDAKALQQLQAQLEQMSVINQANPNYFNREQLNAIFVAVETLKLKLESTQNNLQSLYNHLNELGFKPAVPPTIESVFNATTIKQEDKPKAKPHKNKVTPIEDLQDKTLVEIIEQSSSPYGDVFKILSNLTVEDAISQVKVTEADGRTALHAAAKINDLALMELLVSFDADIGKEDQLQKKAVDYLPVAAEQGRVFLLSREKWQVDAEDLEFSVTRTASLLEEAVQHIENYPGCAKPAVYNFGRTGGGKSSLINFINGTNYKLQIENGEFVLTPSNAVNEIAKTGSKSTSTTQLPELHTLHDYTYIDMPGFEDTSGKEEDIRTGVVTQLIAQNCKSTKAIQVIFTDADLFDTRRTELRKTLKKVGLMLQANPEDLSKHLLLIITKPNKDRLAQGNYEEVVFKRLQHWLKEEIGKRQANHADYPIKLVLQHLEKDQILLVDAANPETRAVYKERFALLPKAVETKQFKFATFDASTQAFKHFIQKIDNYHQGLVNETAVTLTALSYHWQQANVFNNTCYKSEVTDLQSHASLQAMLSIEKEQCIQHEMLNNLMQLFNNQYHELANSNHGIVGDTQEITHKLTQLIQESKLNKPFLYRLGQLAPVLDLTVSESLKQIFVNKAPESNKYENTCIGDYCGNHVDATIGSAWPLPGAAGQLVSFSYLPESNLRMPADKLPVPALIIDQPQNNNYTAIPENLIHFDYGAWDKNPSLHPETSEPIFTYRAYENNTEVGAMSFYKHPLLCRSEAGDRHNLLAMTGIFKQINFDTKTLEEVCAALPPALFDKAIASAKHGASHGAIRGVANVVGYTLHAKRVPKKIANIIQQALYYSGYFILRYNEHASRQKDNEWESMFNSLTQAAKDTSSIFIMSWTVNWLSNKIQQIGLNVERCGWAKTGRAFQFFGRNSQYAMYAYDINQTGIEATASSIVAGAVTKRVVEKIGIPLANKL